MSRHKSPERIQRDKDRTIRKVRRELIYKIRRLFDSRASTKFRSGRREDVSFFDACLFWRINAGSNAEDLRSRFADITTILAEADRVKHGSGKVAAGAVRTLREIHAFLQERFKPEIDYIKARKK